MSLKVKNNNKALSKMFIVAIVLVIIIVIAGAAAYGFMSQNPADPATTPTSTPTNEPSTSESASPSATEPAETAEPTETAVGVSEASSLKFNVNLIENGALQVSYTYMAKNIGTDEFSLVIQVEDIDGQTIYIFNGEQQKAWSNVGGEWKAEISGYYESELGVWKYIWDGYLENLEAWSGVGDYSYNQEGTIVEFTDIEVNPVLADSLFEHIFV